MSSLRSIAWVIVAAFFVLSVPHTVSGDEPCFYDCVYMYPAGWQGFQPSNNPQCCYVASPGTLARGSCAEHQPNLFRCDPSAVFLHNAGAILIGPGNLQRGKQLSENQSIAIVVYTKLPCYCFYDEQGAPQCACEVDYLESVGTYLCENCEQESY